MVGLRDDDPLGAAVGHDEVGGNRVRVVVDPRDHPGHDILHVAAELELRVVGDRRQHAEERRECGEQRQHLVPLGFLPEQGLELFDLVGVLGGEIVGLA